MQYLEPYCIMLSVCRQKVLLVIVAGFGFKELSVPKYELQFCQYGMGNYVHLSTVVFNVV